MSPPWAPRRWKTEWKFWLSEQIRNHINDSLPVPTERALSGEEPVRRGPRQERNLSDTWTGSGAATMSSDPYFQLRHVPPPPEVTSGLQEGCMILIFYCTIKGHSDKTQNPCPLRNFLKNFKIYFSYFSLKKKKKVDIEDSGNIMPSLAMFCGACFLPRPPVLPEPSLYAWKDSNFSPPLVYFYSV